MVAWTINGGTAVLNTLQSLYTCFRMEGGIIQLEERNVSLLLYIRQLLIVR